MSNKPTRFSHKIRQHWLTRRTYEWFDVFASDFYFFLLIAGLSVISWMMPLVSPWANWFGFAVSAYGVISNDSIQTLGVFISANAHRSKWLKMWFFIGTIFLCTIGFSWYWFDKDVSFGRLRAPGVASPDHLTKAQLALPILLLLLTRLRIPASTSFFLISGFVDNGELVLQMIQKSFLAYFSGFFLALLAWGLSYTYQSPTMGPAKLAKKTQWFKVQWITTGLLWSAWLMQDGANMAIFLPRQLDWPMLLLFAFFGLALLAYFFFCGGGKIQGLVQNKSHITDIRAASGINAFYMLLLFFFTFINKCPMSTTWLFIGVLGGRELASNIWKYFSYGKPLKKCFIMIAKDFCYISLGLVISILFTYFYKPQALEGMWQALGRS